MTRIKLWSKMTYDEIWQAWLVQFDNETEAIITAVWIGNRLAKTRAQSTKKRFYEIKDAWIERNQNNLQAGYKVRREVLDCRECEGKGKAFVDNGYIVCPKCHGTGEYKARWLYLHVFDIDGQRYSFHSYEKPKSLEVDLGEDKEAYGGKFSQEELDDLALPMSGIAKVLHYAITRLWGWQFDKIIGYYNQ